MMDQYGCAAESAADTSQFVTFIVQDQIYGIPIETVREIQCWTNLTPLPNQPEYARGVMNLRGAIVPVHDLRARLGGGRTEVTESHIIVITQVGGRVLGLLVDSVSDIMGVAEQNVQIPPPGVDASISRALVPMTDDRIVTILNLPGLLQPNGID